MLPNVTRMLVEKWIYSMLKGIHPLIILTEFQAVLPFQALDMMPLPFFTPAQTLS